MPLHPLDDLLTDHRVIEKVLTALEKVGETTMSRAFYVKAAAFITGFADGYHHAKEEAHLFPLLARRGIPHEMGPIGVMEHEHELARAQVATIRAMINDNDLEALPKETLAYAALMRDHIMKEDQALFPMAIQVLSDADVEELTTQFRRVDESGHSREMFIPVADDLLEQAQAALQED